MRSPMSKFIMVPRKVAEYHEGFNNITLDLIKNIEMKKDSHSALLSDVPSLLFNWSFECEYIWIILESCTVLIYEKRFCSCCFILPREAAWGTH